MCADFQNPAVQIRRIGYPVGIVSHLPRLSHASHREAEYPCVKRVDYV